MACSGVTSSRCLPRSGWRDQGEDRGGGGALPGQGNDAFCAGASGPASGTGSGGSGLVPRRVRRAGRPTGPSGPVTSSSHTPARNPSFRCSDSSARARTPTSPRTSRMSTRCVFDSCRGGSTGTLRGFPSSSPGRKSTTCVKSKSRRTISRSGTRGNRTRKSNRHASSCSRRRRRTTRTTPPARRLRRRCAWARDPQRHVAKATIMAAPKARRLCLAGRTREKPTPGGVACLATGCHRGDTFG